MHDRRTLMLGAAATLMAPSIARAGGVITVFAAASLQESLTAAGAVFTARSGTSVRFSFGASSAIARQISQGAPADVLTGDHLQRTFGSDKGLFAHHH